MYNMYNAKRRKRRPIHGLKSVEVSRGKAGYGFTISGQNPCILSCIVAGCPADRVGLKPGDYLVAVNTENVSKYIHDDVIRMIGMSTGTLMLQVAENYNSSDSSDEDYQIRPKTRHHNRLKVRPSNSAVNNENKVPKMTQRSSQQLNRDLMGERLLLASRHNHKMTSSTTQNRVRFEQDVMGPQGEVDPATVTHRAKQSAHGKSYSSSNIHQMEKKNATSSLRPGVYPGGPAFTSRYHGNNMRVSTQGSLPRPKSLSAVQCLQFETPQNQRRMLDITERLVEGRVTTPKVAPSLEVSNTEDQQVTNMTKPDVDLVPPLQQKKHISRNASIASLANVQSSDSGELLMRALIGYVGSLEMPNQNDIADNRLQSIRSAVRRLRMENKIHTLVLMEVFDAEIRLTNSFGNILATYPAEKLAFSGVCPDDNRFFGIVTKQIAEEESAAEWVTSGLSCHVFMTDVDMVPHDVHQSKAQAFGLECTQSRLTDTCCEFPICSKPIVRIVSQLLSQLRGGNDDDKKWTRSLPFAEPVVVAPQQHRNNSMSSNSDSGLGFGREDNVFVVNVHKHAAYSSVDTSDSFTNSTPSNLHHPSPVARPTMRRPPQYSIEERLNHTQNLNDTRTSVSSEDIAAGDRQSTNRIGYHTTPDRCGLSALGQKSASHVEAMRNNVQKYMKDRQRLASESLSNTSSELSTSFFSNSRTQSASSFPRDRSDRPRSAPYRHLSNSSLASACSQTVDSCGYKKTMQYDAPELIIRSPSAPPLGEQVDQSDGDYDDMGFCADGVCQSESDKVSRFEDDNKLRVTAPSDEQRRFSDGHALLNWRDNEGIPKQEPRSTGNTLRRQRNFNQSISHSHESLFTVEQENSNWKLLSAASVSCVSPKSGGGGNGSPQVVGRVAGWAVNLDRLLLDPAGLSLFTEFSEKEFSEENITFWKTCEDFKKIVDQEQMKQTAGEIYARHVSSQAADPVNVDSAARKAAEEHLDQPTHKMFNMAQTQILQLMKQDIYTRFLKSDLFKASLMAEMEGKSVDHRSEPANTEGTGQKHKGNNTADEKKRRSLLPWMKSRNAKAKVTSVNRLVGIKENTTNTHRKPSMVNVDLSLMGKEVKVEVDESRDRAAASDATNSRQKFCRVILPNGATTVVCAKQGQTIRVVLGQLCEKRNISMNSIEVLLLGSDTCVNLDEDIAMLGSKEIVIEQRVLFRMDLPNHKSIGVKAKPNRPIRDVLKPILNKYAYKIENVTVRVSGDTDLLDMDALTSTLDNTRLHVATKDEKDTNSDERRMTIKPPIPASKALANQKAVSGNNATSRDEITNRVFDDLMHGKSKVAHNFDEDGALDLETRQKGKNEKKDDEHRLSGLFWLLKKEALGLKEGGKAKSSGVIQPHKDSSTLPRSALKKTGSTTDDKFFELLERMQSQRLDDQRGVTLSSLQLPDFLKKSSDDDDRCVNTTSSGHTRPNQHDPDSPSSVNVISLRGSGASYDSSRSITSFKTFGSPTDKVPYIDSSFSLDGVHPDLDNAAAYFNPRRPPRPASMLDGRTVDIGLSHGLMDSSMISLSSTDSVGSVINRPLRKIQRPFSTGTTSLIAPKASPEKFSAHTDDDTIPDENSTDRMFMLPPPRVKSREDTPSLTTVEKAVRPTSVSSFGSDIYDGDRSSNSIFNQLYNAGQSVRQPSSSFSDEPYNTDQSRNSTPQFYAAGQTIRQASSSSFSSDLYNGDDLLSTPIGRPPSVCSARSHNLSYSLSDCSLHISEQSFDPDLTVLSGTAADDSVQDDHGNSPRDSVFTAGKTPEDVRRLRGRQNRNRNPVVFTAQLNDITFV